VKSYLIIFLFLFINLSYLFSQKSRAIDSLQQRLKTAKTDSARCYRSDELALEYYEIQPDSGIAYANQSLCLAKKINNPEYIIDANITLGMINRGRGEYNTSLNHLHTALDIAKEHHVKSHYFMRIYACLNLSYTEQGNYTAGIEYGFKSLHEIEKTHDTLAMALSNNNIANTYFQIKQYDKAMMYYKIALTYAKQTKNLYGQSLLTGNIGSVYFETQKFDSAKLFYDRSLQLSKQLEDPSGEAVAYGNIGSYYQQINDNKSAIEYYNKAEKIYSELKMQPNLADMYYSLANSYLNVKEYNQSLNYANRSLNIADKTGSLPAKEQAHLALKNVYEKLNNIPQAYYHYKEYIAARDSTFNEQNKKNQFKAELVYEYNKKRYTDSLTQAVATNIQQKELNQEREKTQTLRKFTIAAVIGFMLMLILALFILKGYKDKQKANKIISEQKNQVEIQKQKIEFQKIVLETKNKEVTDSITYAKRLQEAILPPHSFVKQFLPESFIFYKPKDIVAGDFYWMEPIKDDILIAAADCTGHGVPGAIVSVVCSNALNRAVKEFKITDPGKILDKVRELVVETFENSESEVKDGMDISLCSINKKTNELKWSGANNSLWIISNNDLIELKPNKQPIGKIDYPTPFTTHSITLKPNDSVYLFSDGMADQFGGEKGKKFKYSQLKETFLSIRNESMDAQSKSISGVLENWKGNLEQVDDILIIGIRIQHK
jgi:serine phosphatase RsbU (regulator of sigma subunit)